MRDRNSNCGDSILAKFNNYRSNGKRNHLWAHRATLGVTHELKVLLGFRQVTGHTCLTPLFVRVSYKKRYLVSRVDTTVALQGGCMRVVRSFVLAASLLNTDFDQ